MEDGPLHYHVGRLECARRGYITAAMTLRLAFMGTPDFAAPSLTEIITAGHDVACVYTQPPRPAGRRGREMTKSPVHELAEGFGIEVRTPDSLKSEEEQARFAALELDAACVVAYGQILPPAILEAPEFGCLNLHASLLPRWRGAAPIQRAIMAGDAMTGVQIMQMAEGLDTGDILLSETARIYPFETAGSLHDRLMETGSHMWPRALAALERGGLTATPQGEDGVTYARKIEKAEARIDWTRPGEEIDRLIRGLSPFPGAWFEIETPKGKARVKALQSKFEPEESGAPGEVLDTALLVGTGEGAVRLTRLQREGRPVMDAEDFLRGAQTGKGERLL